MKTKQTILVAAMLLALGQAHAAGLFGQNLIVNGDAEASAGSNEGMGTGSIPGFTVNGGAAVVLYGGAGGFPLSTDPGPANRGLNFFGGGQDNEFSSIRQLLDVSAGAAAIDLGAGFDLSAFLGGFAGQADQSVLTITFLSGANVALGSASLGPVTASDRNALTGLLARDVTGFVPIGTRAIDVSLAMTRFDGSYNDGYADNLSLVLTAAPVPEPTSLALLGAGFAALWARVRRRTQTEAA